MPSQSIPFHSYILKVASRCNLNCSYCFVYNKADNRWREQPPFMTAEVVRRTCQRIVQHCLTHDKRRVHIILHGGEPLLGGLDHLRELTATIKEELVPNGVRSSIGMQSNGLLFNKQIGDFCLENRITIGVSIDGPPEINDQHRVYHSGKPSTADLEARLALMTSDTYKSIFSGLLCVVNISADPATVLNYLAGLNPPAVDFILPYDNHDRLPAGKKCFDSTEYGDWMIALFDHWFSNYPHIPLREFDSILRLLFSGRSLVESIGSGPVDLIVVETNGDIEAVDSLKATYHGAPILGLNVFEHSFDEAATHHAVTARHLGAEALCTQCQSCNLVEMCGGGYLPNRFSQRNGFNNPSVYCRDLYKLISHIKSRAVAQLATQ